LVALLDAALTEFAGALFDADAGFQFESCHFCTAFT